jgi:hypothetical protein
MITLVVETAAGTYIRTVPSASPLRDDVNHGAGAEEATEDAAALWGLPDLSSGVASFSPLVSDYESACMSRGALASSRRVRKLDPVRFVNSVVADSR